VFAAEIEFLSLAERKTINKPSEKATERSGEKRKRKGEKDGWSKRKGEGRGEAAGGRKAKVTKLRIRHVALGLTFVLCSTLEKGVS